MHDTTKQRALGGVLFWKDDEDDEDSDRILAVNYQAYPKKQKSYSIAKQARQPLPDTYVYSIQHETIRSSALFIKNSLVKNAVFASWFAASCYINKKHSRGVGKEREGRKERGRREQGRRVWRGSLGGERGERWRWVC